MADGVRPNATDRVRRISPRDGLRRCADRAALLLLSRPPRALPGRGRPAAEGRHARGSGADPPRATGDDLPGVRTHVRVGGTWPDVSLLSRRLAPRQSLEARPPPSERARV